MCAERAARYYAGWTIDPAKEIVPERASEASMHMRVERAAGALPEKRELYEGRNLTAVHYYDPSVEAPVLAAHLQQYRGVPFATHRTLGSRAGFTWESIRSYTGEGALSAITSVLLDRNGRGVMEVGRDPEGRLQTILKFLWSPAGKLDLVFEYRSDGALEIVHDAAEGEDVSMADVKDRLPDRGFFETGFALPRDLAGTSIP